MPFRNICSFVKKYEIFFINPTKLYHHMYLNLAMYAASSKGFMHSMYLFFYSIYFIIACFVVTIIVIYDSNYYYFLLAY